MSPISKIDIDRLQYPPVIKRGNGQFPIGFKDFPVKTCEQTSIFWDFPAKLLIGFQEAQNFGVGKLKHPGRLAELSALRSSEGS